MKLKKTKAAQFALALGSLAISLAGANAAVDTAYNTNDVLLFGQNPTGTTGTDQVFVFSLGSTYDVFRDAATPGDASFGTTISLGNINAGLTSTYGADWANLDSTLFFGAAGQNGATTSLSTATSNQDYARTVYVTKPRTGAGTVGASNSAGVTLPGTTGNQSTLAANINTSNNGAIAAGQPGAAQIGSTTIDNNNPFSNGNPSTAYGQLPGGVMGSISSTTYSMGSVDNIVIGLDLYRATPVLNASGWQNIEGISGVTAGQGYYLGTITLSSNGDVNFIAVPEPSTAMLLGMGLVVTLYGKRRRKVAE